MSNIKLEIKFTIVNKFNSPLVNIVINYVSAVYYASLGNGKIIACRLRAGGNLPADKSYEVMDNQGEPFKSITESRFGLVRVGREGVSIFQELSDGGKLKSDSVSGKEIPIKGTEEMVSVFEDI